MTRRTALALTIGLSSICLLAGNGIGHTQQSDADKVKATIDGFHTAISSLDIRKMDEVWAHEPYAMVVNPRDKTVTVGWDAIRKNFEGGVFQFWSELKVTGRDAPIIHINERLHGPPALRSHPENPRRAAKSTPRHSSLQYSRSAVTVG
jgi:hypothetical protein